MNPTRSPPLAWAILTGRAVHNANTTGNASRTVLSGGRHLLCSFGFAYDFQSFTQILATQTFSLQVPYWLRVVGGMNEAFCVLSKFFPRLCAHVGGRCLPICANRFSKLLCSCRECRSPTAPDVENGPSLPCVSFDTLHHSTGAARLMWSWLQTSEALEMA
eukprot:3796767-Amphidinium_carterae.1